MARRNVYYFYRDATQRMQDLDYSPFSPSRPSKIDRRSFRLGSREPTARNSCGKIQVARCTSRILETLRPRPFPSSSAFNLLSPPARQDGKFFFSRSSRRDRDRDRDQLRGNVEEGLILYLNTGLSRRTTCILTTGQMPRLSRCPVAQASSSFRTIVTRAKDVGPLNPKDGLPL